MKLLKRIVSGIMLTLLLMSVFLLAFNTQPVMSDYACTEPIYIRADGSVEPDTAPISSVDNITYKLTDNIINGNTSTYAEAIELQRDNIVIDGACYTIQGPGVYGNYSYGIYLDGRSKVTIKNVTIKAFDAGILFYSSLNSIISGNSLMDNTWSIALYNCSNCIVSGNYITNMTALSWVGIYLSDSISKYNIISGNNIANNGHGIYTWWSSNSRIFHNNFVDNVIQAYLHRSKDIWDNGCEGNYWSDYNGTDSNGDGIGGTSNVIDANNTDNYPLMNPYWVWIPADVNHDMKVDILDVVKITGAYGATPSSSNWNPNADIAEPYDKIDILDLVLCTSHYAEKYS